jgi:hypothetical protein
VKRSEASETMDGADNSRMPVPVRPGDPFGQPEKAPAKTYVDDLPSEVARDGYGRYLLPDPTGKKTKAVPFTRATTFAKSISDTFALSEWAQRMGAKGLAQNPDLLMRVATLDLDRDKREINTVFDEAKNRAGAKTAANLGTALHAFSEQVDRGQSPTIPEPYDKDIEAYTALLDAHGLEIVDEYIERIVLEETYEIAGTFDRIVRAGRDIEIVMPTGEVVKIEAGELVVLDLKTGRDLSYGWNEIAIQLAIYANARYIYNRPENKLDLMPIVRTDVALVLHLPVGKATATMYALDIVEGWKACLLCKLVRDWRKHRKLSVPIAVAEVDTTAADDPNSGTDPIRVTAERVAHEDVAGAVVRKASLGETIESLNTEAEIRAVRHQAQLDRTWTQALDRVALKRLKTIWADSTGG